MILLAEIKLDFHCLFCEKLIYLGVVFTGSAKTLNLVFGNKAETWEKNQAVNILIMIMKKCFLLFSTVLALVPFL